MFIHTHICLQSFRNSYLIASKKTREAIIIDPAGIDVRLIETIESNNYLLKAAMLTTPRTLHERPIKTLRRIYPVQLFCVNHQIEDNDLKNMEINPILPDQEFELLSAQIKPIAMSSHGIQTVVYQIGECLFTGDVLGAGNIGEPISSFAMALLKIEIQEKLMTLPSHTLIFPANGPPSTIEAELRTNPYLQEAHDPFQPSQ